MAFLKLCPDDKIVSTLQSVFRANIVRVPESRIQPLTALTLSEGRTQYWGTLNELVDGQLPAPSSVTEQSRMADISGKQTKSVNLALGLQILEGFLSGIGLPSAGISTKFTGAKTVSFSFQETVRYYVSPGKLGGLLRGLALDAENSANDIFQNGARLLVVDSVITSKDFSINVDSAAATDFKLDVPAIQKIIGNAKADVQVVSSTGLDVTFKGNTPLTFAFTCVRCDADEAGRLTVKPGSNTVSFAAEPSVEHELLSDEPSMIELHG